MVRTLFITLTILMTSNCIGQSTEILESYSDSIMSSGGELYIIHLTRVESNSNDGHIARIAILNKGVLIDSFSIDKDPVIGCEPKVYDYNGDGYMDYSFVSDIAARGANELRTLFIYSPKDKRFIHVKNSESFPNIIYNPKLKCMDSWAFHGGTSQYFLRLKSDSLVPTFGIDVYETERILREYNNGEWSRVKSDTIEDKGFPRYINYEPFEEYE